MSQRTLILIILIVLLLGALPLYPYSAAWGWYPPVGLIVVILLIFFLL
jgi:low affinity Fe/Cu permease